MDSLFFFQLSRFILMLPVKPPPTPSCFIFFFLALLFANISGFNNWMVKSISSLFFIHKVFIERLITQRI